MGLVRSVLEGKVALVTGGTSVIGEGMARKLASLGAGVAIHYNTSIERARPLALEIGGVAVQGDLASSGEVTRMVEEVVSELGQVDILVHNAGVYYQEYVRDLTVEQWDETIGVYLNGAFYLTRQVLGEMRASNWGRIVFIGTGAMGRIRGFSRLAHYTAAKTGLAGFAQSLAREEAEKHITVNVINPGVVQHEHDTEEDLQFGLLHVPANELTSVEDLTRALEYLVDPANDQVTGTFMDVAGGMFL